MPDWQKNTAHPDEELAPSKSERKRQMHALQELGASLLELNEKQLDAMPIEDEQLLLALRECKAIRSNSARKRHLQLIGKLMRNVDPAPLQAALQRLHHDQQQATEDFHELETLRDRLLVDGANAIEPVLERFPDADRQHLRQLLRQHQQEVQNNKPPAASRKLFRYLRELHEA
ncbi:MAG: ribosome biogenesis factor YjgA [Halioglobus sp.]